MRAPGAWGNTPDHRAYMRDYSHAQYWRRRLDGVCTACGRARVRRFVICPACRRKAARRTR
jgi:uncharacterized OB-fold protein